MEFQALRLLISNKLDKGRLPLNSVPRVWGGPGHGETCDGCDSIITANDFVMEGISLATLRLHARCFWIWESERRPRLAAAERAARGGHGTMQ